MIQNKVTHYYEALGVFVELCFHAKKYHFWDMYDIQRNFIPALQLSQYEVFFDENDAPVGFITWALFDESTHTSFLCDGVPPTVEHWANGSNLWLMDTIAPFGGTLEMVRILTKNRFRDVSVARSIKRKEDGTIQRIKVWKNFNPSAK